LHNDTYKKIDLIFIFLIFAFSVFIRIFFIYYHDGAALIHTADGFTFAEASRDILAGFHQEFDQSKVDQPLALFTAFLARILPFSLDTIMFYMSAIIGSLIILPVMLIAKELNLGKITAYYAALFSILSSAYFHRSVAGYYDTDMALLLFPLCVIYFAIKALRTQEQQYILLSAVCAALYQWYYVQGYSLNVGIALVLGYYALKDYWPRSFQTQLFLSVFAALLKIPLGIKLLLIFILYRYFKRIDPRLIFWFLFLVFAYNGGFLPLYEKIAVYTNKEIQTLTPEGLHYFNLLASVAESNKSGLNIVIEHSTGLGLLFGIALAGLLILLVKFERLLLALPMIGLGLLSIKLGLRFVIYLVPFLGLGIGYSLHLLYQRSKHIFWKSVLIVLALLSLIPNIQKDLAFKPSPLISYEKIKVLEEFKAKSSRRDYVIAWWDYGYLLKYYSDVHVIADGGRQGAENIFLTAKLFTSTSPLQVYNLALLSTYYSHNFYRYNLGHKGHYGQFNQMLKDFPYQDPHTFLDTLKRKKINLKPPFDTYIYFDSHYLQLFSLFKMFGDRDLMTGKIHKNNIFYSYKIRDYGDGVKLWDAKNNAVKLNRKNLTISTYTQPAISLKIKRLINYSEQDTFGFQAHQDGELNVIFFKETNAYLLLDECSFQSAFIQMMLFKNYNPSLFELVVEHKDIKMYKVKF
jgi:dolichyl-diphosphooligosaccharide--protein glycosyltransferase/undecaprenyl-diphosphooligosaccharide--protein glycosyltransferase